MAQLVVKWSNRALRKLDDQSLWYLANCGEIFVKTFVENVRNSVETISGMPGIGVLRKQTSTRTYRLYHHHPKCAIYYCYNTKEVYIVDLIFTRQGAMDA